MRAEQVLVPSTGVTRSRALATTSSRVMGFSTVPRTSRIHSLNCAPSARVSSTMASRRGRRASMRGSASTSTLARWRKTAGSCMRALSCAEAKVTVLSSSMMATMCCMQISGISRLLTVLASSLAMRTTTFRTSSAAKDRFWKKPASASSGAWIGEPTVHFLMLVRVIS